MSIFVFALAILAGVGGCKKIETEFPGVEMKMTWDGISRNYILFVPSNIPQAPMPMILTLHGGGGTAKGLQDYMRFNDWAEEEGVVVIYPDAVDKHWTIGATPSYGGEVPKVDDLGFIGALIDTAIAKYGVDSSRVFATGPSRGGMFSFYLASKIPDKLAGVAPLIASVHVNLQDSFRYRQPVPTLAINGTEDPLILYNGGSGGIGGNVDPDFGGGVMPIETLMQKIASWKGCEASWTQMSLPNEAKNDGCQSTEYTFTNCPETSPTILIKVEGGGHAIPGEKQYLPKKWIGKASQDFSGTRRVWDFFIGL